MKIEYIERGTGLRCIERVWAEKTLFLLYGDLWHQRLFSAIFLPLLTLPIASRIVAFLQKRKQSARKILPFIQAYGIDASEFEDIDFKSFHDFFIRKLKAERRPIVKDTRRLAMPADGRYFVFPEFDRFFVKGQEFSLASFLQDRILARRFSEGSMAIVRLCPTDYHRFHFPCDGVPSSSKLINGPLFSVNPIALKKRISILSENKRMITEIETQEFGTLLYVEIGATSVGSIRQTFTAKAPVQKGQEKGYFEFGGSCIVLLFEKKRIAFDPDLVVNSQAGLETRANFGESLGICFSPTTWKT